MISEACTAVAARAPSEPMTVGGHVFLTLWGVGAIALGTVFVTHADWVSRMANRKGNRGPLNTPTGSASSAPSSQWWAQASSSSSSSICCCSGFTSATAAPPAGYLLRCAAVVGPALRTAMRAITPSANQTSENQPTLVLWRHRHRRTP